MTSVRRVINWLGPTRAQIIFVLLALTGLGSLVLNAVGTKVAVAPLVQSLLLIAFLVGGALTVLSRFSARDRRQAALVIVPMVAAVSLGLLFPSLLVFFVPVGVGWLLIAIIASRGRIRREYQAAIKHMRKGEYNDAIHVMGELIKAEPDNADHHRFRAELYRLSGKVRRARDDYEKVIELMPDSGVGYNGLAEVYLQDGEYEAALPFAKQALEREPDQWVAPYNLGMIEDRLNLWNDSVEHLGQALRVGVPDSRHRLLVYLWLARSNLRLGKADEAEADLQKMKRERVGLNEWNTIFESEEAAVLRNVLLDDIQLAQRLVDGETTLNALSKVGEV
jgi:tetratricopeptide (TPR) repeat protein